ncbi:hypothetical protein [Oerskovia enterophila]|uniref:Uncharacterized protein n=1 Tax=Oerskovia enterophila TaxID=43678 RepID=A0ABX2Y8X4_9CELL|nr:hypothetical protein [Oerskovia enterophila]OCI32708.1 hypothetical protein OERS_06390 [Oerskovia enterophila]
MTRDSILALIPALFALGSAIIAAIFAYKAKSRENEAARIRQLEERLSAKKTAMYEPVLQALGNMLTPDAAKANLRGDSKVRAELSAEEAIPRFMIDSITYASDEVLVAFARFRLASAAVPTPPAQITMRLVADFMIAIRKDIVGPASKATGIELMGVRINDLFSSKENVDALTLSLEELSQEHDWRAPWHGRPELGLNPEPRWWRIPSPNRRRR